MKTGFIAFLLALLVALPVAGCGTIVFEERQGEPHSDRLDPNVLIMDGFGLLLFIVPGVVAFLVDFHSGAIYLPPDVDKGEGPFIKD